MTHSPHFADRLVDAIKRKKSPICVGLDPRIDRIPGFLKDEIVLEKGRSFEAASEAIVAFNKGLIDAVHDLVPVVKPQFAYYMQYGFAGAWAFDETCKYAQEKGLLVIADAKVNDIGSTAEAYANAFLGTTDLFGEEVEPLGADAVTVNAYLGLDGVRPFVNVCKKKNKGIFILVKTSNPSSGDLQERDIVQEKMQVYELMGHFVESWGADDIGTSGYSSIGAVVGATFPQQAAKLRKLMPHTFFLVPGFGAQGAGADEVKVCFNSEGLGAVINSSRDINYAWEKQGDERNYATAAREAVLEMRKRLS